MKLAERDVSKKAKKKYPSPDEIHILIVTIQGCLCNTY